MAEPCTHARGASPRSSSRASSGLTYGRILNPDAAKMVSVEGNRYKVEARLSRKKMCAHVAYTTSDMHTTRAHISFCILHTHNTYVFYRRSRLKGTDIRSRQGYRGRRCVHM
eukprot:5911497-Pyramimonas_sp.AAC.1